MFLCLPLSLDKTQKIHWEMPRFFIEFVRGGFQEAKDVFSMQAAVESGKIWMGGFGGLQVKLT